MVYLDGHPLTQDDVEKIGYLPEERGLYKKMKVGEQAVFFARLKGLSKADATRELRSWFEKFDILSWWDKKVEELSKGMAHKTIDFRRAFLRVRPHKCQPSQRGNIETQR